MTNFDPVRTGRCTRWRRHTIHVHYINAAGAQSYREGTCTRCRVRFQQHLSWGGKPEGPWRDTTPIPCTHGVGGVAVPSCMVCAVARSDRGLRR